jgi:hypothetical protein
MVTSLVRKTTNKLEIKIVNELITITEQIAIFYINANKEIVTILDICKYIDAHIRSDSQ